MNCTIGFEKIHPDAVIPTRSSELAAGYDFSIIRFEECDNKVLGFTGLKIAINPSYFMGLFVRSSSPTKGFQLSNAVGIIDPDYRGEIIAQFDIFNYNDMEWLFHHRGITGKCSKHIDLPARLIQGVVFPRVDVSWLEATLGETPRGSGGFGSSGH